MEKKKKTQQSWLTVALKGPGPDNWSLLLAPDRVPGDEEHVSS